mmetsp:Transcript_113158/g.320262  ORF Transcript_113158/g.320262 Transcript_113158/m.320262 type:complete len:618 (-) Transcript_113158:39-1892(-)
MQAETQVLSEVPRPSLIGLLSGLLPGSPTDVSRSPTPSPASGRGIQTQQVRTLERISPSRLTTPRTSDASVRTVCISKKARSSRTLKFKSSGAKQTESDGLPSDPGVEADPIPEVVKPPAHTPRPYKWFAPGKMRLNEVDPRRVAEISEGGIQRATKLDMTCSKFQGSCMNARLRHVHGTAQYMMLFTGTPMVLNAPTSVDDTGFIDEEEVPDTETSSNDSDSIFDDPESSEEEEETNEEDEAASHSTGFSDSTKSLSDDGGKCWNIFWRKGSENNGIDDNARSKIEKLESNKTPDAMVFPCTRKNHPIFLHDKVYAKRCEDLDLRINSGVQNLLLNSSICFCNLETMSFRDFLLGDRGIEGILPLFRSVRRLKSLSLAGNRIREKGLRLVSNALRDPSILVTLVVLDLSYNPITSVSVPELMRLLTQRTSILMLGLMGTTLPGVRRQRLLWHTMASFAASDPCDMCKAWQLSGPGSGFADLPHWVQCTPIVEEHCSREQLAECMEFIANYKEIIQSNTPPPQNLVVARPPPPVATTEPRRSSPRDSNASSVGFTPPMSKRGSEVESLSGKNSAFDATQPRTLADANCGLPLSSDAFGPASRRAEALPRFAASHGAR